MGQVERISWVRRVSLEGFLRSFLKEEEKEEEEGVSFGIFFFFFFSYGLGCTRKGRGFLYDSPNTSHPKATLLSSLNRPSRSNSHSNQVGLLIMSFPFRHCAM